MLEILLLIAFVVLPLIQQYLSRRQQASQPPGHRPAPRASVPAPPLNGRAAAPLGAERREASVPAAARAPVPAVKAPVVRRKGRTRPGGWKLSEADARRAIVLMTLFGPCRALGPYGQEQSE